MQDKRSHADKIAQEKENIKYWINYWREYYEEINRQKIEELQKDPNWRKRVEDYQKEQQHHL